EAFGENVASRIMRVRLVTSAATVGFDGGVADRPVAGATAEIAGELLVEVVVGAEIAAIVAFEKRADEAGRAIAALGTKTLGHRALNRVRTFATDAFHADDFAAGEQANRHQATVHRTESWFAG